MELMLTAGHLCMRLLSSRNQTPSVLKMWDGAKERSKPKPWPLGH